MVNDNLVSVIVLTYNHCKYISECLESILTQQTTFKYEICLGEDESSDGTREICLDFAKRYPEKINLFLRSRKDVIYVYGNATGRSNFLKTLEASKGKYIAFCDGDDYWTDPLKLQKQVDLMEENSNVSLVHHAVSELNEAKMEIRHISKKNVQKELQSKSLALKNNIHTASVLFRKENLRIPNWFGQVRQADWAMWLLLSEAGEIRVMQDNMSCYRIHTGSTWSSKSTKGLISMTRQSIQLFNACFENRYKKEFIEHSNSLYYYALFDLARSGSFFLFAKYWFLALYFCQSSTTYQLKDLLNQVKSILKR